MLRPRYARLIVPSTLTVTLLGAVGCSSPTAPGPCVSHFVVPAGATAPPAGVQPQIDLSPCPAQRAGADWFCITASGCQVVYVGETNSAIGAPVQSVSCPTTDQCLWGLDASGQPVSGACPQLDVQPQQCTNVFRLDDPSRSNFECNAEQLGCPLSGGGQGHRLASVTRFVTGGVDSTECPTPCVHFA